MESSEPGSSNPSRAKPLVLERGFGTSESLKWIPVATLKHDSVELLPDGRGSIRANYQTNSVTFNPINYPNFRQNLKVGEIFVVDDYHYRVASDKSKKDDVPGLHIKYIHFN